MASPARFIDGGGVPSGWYLHEDLEQNLRRRPVGEKVADKNTA